jgi:hypothetical protein
MRCSFVSFAGLAYHAGAAAQTRTGFFLIPGVVLERAAWFETPRRSGAAPHHEDLRWRMGGQEFWREAIFLIPRSTP